MDDKLRKPLDILGVPHLRLGLGYIAMQGQTALITGQVDYRNFVSFVIRKLSITI